MRKASRTRHSQRFPRLEALEERSMLTSGPFSYTTLDVPGASHTGDQGNHDAGQIVGYYNDAGDIAHGFLLSGGSYTTLNVPGEAIHLDGPNRRINDAGQVVGS